MASFGIFCFFMGFKETRRGVLFLFLFLHLFLACAFTALFVKAMPSMRDDVHCASWWATSLGVISVAISVMIFIVMVLKDYNAKQAGHWDDDDEFYMTVFMIQAVPFALLGASILLGQLVIWICSGPCTLG